MKSTFETCSRSRLLGMNFALTAAALIWGTTFFAVKGILGAVDPITLNFYRTLVAVILLGIWCLCLRRNPFRNFKPAILIGIILFLSFATQTIGLETTSAFNSGFITGLFVLFVPIISCIFWRTKITAMQIGALAIAVIGLYLATGGIRGINWGDLLTLFSAVAYSIYVLQCDTAIKNGANPIVLNFQQFFVMCVCCLLTMLIWHLPFAVKTTSAIYVILYLGIFANIGAYGLQLWSQRYLPPINVVMILLLEPVFAGIFAWTLGGEAFVWSKLWGGVLIISAILLTELAPYCKKCVR
ncbi:MAG: DMT family transporter [Gammaproteobacteria bacterium]